MSCSANIVVLAENSTARPDCMAEHGLALWIERGGTQILFDTGQGTALPTNSRALNVPLEEAHAVVLSHGHYDHTGGLSYFLENTTTARVFMNPEAFRQRYSRHADGTIHSIGMRSEIAEALRQLPGRRVVRTTGPMAVADGIWATGPIPRDEPTEDTGGDYFLDAQCKEPDLIPDDQALWMETEKGVVVILGCAHSGVINTLNYIAKLAAAQTFHSVVGGMHLGRASRARLTATRAALLRYRVSEVYPAHCTGQRAVDFLSASSGLCLGTCRAGEKWSL